MRTKPDDSYETKARHLRAFHREHRPRQRLSDHGNLVINAFEQDRHWCDLWAKYERLFGLPSQNSALERILTSTWIEGRELAGQSYDYRTQRWRDAAGNRLA